MTHLEDEGGADGGVEGAHAVQHSITGLQVSQQGGVGVGEDLVVALPPLMAQVEDALDGGLQARPHSPLVHLVATWRVCTAHGLLQASRVWPQEV